MILPTEFWVGVFWMWILLQTSLMSHNIALVFVLSSLSRTVSLPYFLQIINHTSHELGQRDRFHM